MEKIHSADFVLLVVNAHPELAGVDACMGSLHSWDHQFASVLLEGPCSACWRSSGVGVLQEGSMWLNDSSLPALANYLKRV